MSIQLVYKLVPVKEPVLKDTLVFLVETHLKPVLGYSSKVDYCEIDFRNVHVKLHWISAEIQTVLEQEIIELVRLNAAESVGDVDFGSPCISIGSGSLIKIKSVNKSTEYFGQLFISIIAPTEFGP